MEICGMDIRRGSFTVEATFVVSLCIWIVLLICYIAMYAHDCTAMYSLGKHYLEEAFENGKVPSEEHASEKLQKYLQKHVMICKVRDVAVEKKLLSVEAKFTYEAKVSVPFIRHLLTGESGKSMTLTRGDFSPAQRMWDKEMFEN